MSNLPNASKKLRSCFGCKIILSETQFKKSGCPNCLHYFQNRTPYLDYTTSNFEGFISVLDKKSSWITKRFVREDLSNGGCYSLNNIGQEFIE